jgi:hypothetical protein
MASPAHAPTRGSDHFIQYDELLARLSCQIAAGNLFCIDALPPGVVDVPLDLTGRPGKKRVRMVRRIIKPRKVG